MGKDCHATINYLSNSWKVERLDDTRASTVIRALKARLAIYGIPSTVISDDGPQFMKILRNLHKFGILNT